jgi:hypothetical protein
MQKGLGSPVIRDVFYFHYTQGWAGKGCHYPVERSALPSASQLLDAVALSDGIPTPMGIGRPCLSICTPV